jgi:hypothetical protein
MSTPSICGVAIKNMIKSGCKVLFIFATKTQISKAFASAFVTD